MSERLHGVRDQRGVAAVLAVVLTGLLAVVTFVAAGIVGAIDAHRRAQAAADLSALAGGSALVHDADVCAAAATIAGRNGASLVSCGLDGDSVAVVVAVAAPGGLPGVPELRARARAGPAGPGGLAPRSPSVIPSHDRQP
jgi:secretion/DNA translocation related TadE-like protein